ncbi:MAG: endolytic transglycosylase MltG [Bacillota bacterium]|nr:endolytic transglycosylase MltG [Bacillota bacterium]
MLKRILIILALLFIVAMAAVYALNSYYQQMLQPVDTAAEDEYKVIEIPSGAGTESIASILYEERLIQNELAFRFYARRNELDRGFIAGQYKLSPAMRLAEIAALIQKGEVYHETIWFTIPEGFKIEEIAARLTEENLVEEEEFLSLARNPSENILSRFPYLREIDSTEVEYMLEGYLFPDTYEITGEFNEEEIIVLMMQRLDQIISSPDFVAALEEREYSLHEILTLASIVEREGRVDHERALIAGVFYNRLRIGQPLESCATVQYVLGETKEFLTTADTMIPSPYNTYLHAGLPPGPIAAPGETSIRAALFPEESDYFYFNYKYDDTGEHYFSRTLQEHNENVRKAEQNLD